MPAPSKRPTRPADQADSARPGVDEFTRSVHASYLSRWQTHDPSALENAVKEEVTARKRRKRTSAA